MFRAIILPIFRSTRLCVTACGIMHPRCCRPPADNILGTELTGSINKPLLLHLVGCLYYLYKWCRSRKCQIIKYICWLNMKSVLWRVAKRLSYIQDARCLKYIGNFLWSWANVTFWRRNVLHALDCVSDLLITFIIQWI